MSRANDVAGALNAFLEFATEEHNKMIDIRHVLANFADKYRIDMTDPNPEWFAETEEETLAQAKKNIDRELTKYVEVIEKDLSYIQNANDTDSLMRSKQVLLGDIFTGMPLTNITCPFCIKYRDGCSLCVYGKQHGICNRRDDKGINTWGTIQQSKSRVLDKITAYY